MPKPHLDDRSKAAKEGEDIKNASGGSLDPARGTRVPTKLEKWTFAVNLFTMTAVFAYTTFACLTLREMISNNKRAGADTKRLIDTAETNMKESLRAHLTFEDVTRPSAGVEGALARFDVMIKVLNAGRGDASNVHTRVRLSVNDVPDAGSFDTWLNKRTDYGQFPLIGPAERQILMTSLMFPSEVRDKRLSEFNSDLFAFTLGSEITYSDQFGDKWERRECVIYDMRQSAFLQKQWTTCRGEGLSYERKQPAAKQ